MKLNKKFLSCFMAATMMVNSATVFAADEVKVATGVVNGSGTVHYVQTQVYNIILPTNKALDFNIDPYGLLGMEDDDKQTVEEAEENAKNAETNITSKATAIINKSSVPVDVKIAAMVHNAGTVGATTSEAAVKLVTDAADVVIGGTDLSYASMYLAIAPVSGATFGTITPAAVDANLVSFDATNVDAKIVTGEMSALSEAAITGGTISTKDALAVRANGTATNMTEFNTISLKGMPEAYEITSKSTIAVINTGKAADILGNAVSAAAVAFTFNIIGKIDFKSPVFKEFSDNFKTGNKQEIGLQMKFMISKGGSEVLLKNGDTVKAKNGDSSLTFKIQLPENATGIASVSATNPDNGRSYALAPTIEENSITITNENSDHRWFLTNPNTYSLKITFNGTSTVYNMNFVVEN